MIEPKRSVPVNTYGLRLLERLKLDETEGTIHWKHRRMLLFDADAMGLLRKELIETLGISRAKRILADSDMPVVTEML